MPNRPRKLKKLTTSEARNQPSIEKYMSTPSSSTPTEPSTSTTSAALKTRTPPSVEKNEPKQRNMDEEMDVNQTPGNIDPNSKEYQQGGITPTPTPTTNLTLPSMDIPKTNDKNLTMEERMESMETQILETLKACLIPIHQELRNLRTCLDTNVQIISKNSVTVKQLEQTTKTLNQK